LLVDVLVEKPVSFEDVRHFRPWLAQLHSVLLREASDNSLADPDSSGDGRQRHALAVVEVGKSFSGQRGFRDAIRAQARWS
jgi:hypothetical protein